MRLVAGLAAGTGLWEGRALGRAPLALDLRILRVECRVVGVNLLQEVGFLFLSVQSEYVYIYTQKIIYIYVDIYICRAQGDNVSCRVACKDNH